MGRAALAAALLATGAAVPGAEARPVRLVWHVEAAGGEVLDSREADLPINPASVVKIATTLWALERLGPGHRFETRFAARGVRDATSGVLDGDLVVTGGADPDFHVENAWLVARELNAAGLAVVRGRTVVDDRFWVGWEGGAETKAGDARLRRSTMASRLQNALDPQRWDAGTRRSIEAFRARAAVEGTPRVVVEGGAVAEGCAPPESLLVVHRSNPLVPLLKRFNAYSNNDIERLGATLGPPAALADYLSERWGAAPSAPSFASLSGLGKNRMTARQVVRLLHDLVAACERHGIAIADLLPAAGCDAGTLESFPRLEGLPPGTLVAKTGTLVTTDGGVAVLAGIVRTAAGERLFCVAAPGAGSRLVAARAAEERWVLDLVERHGGAAGTGCGAAVGYSTDDVELRRAPEPLRGN